MNEVLALSLSPLNLSSCLLIFLGHAGGKDVHKETILVALECVQYHVLVRTTLTLARGISDARPRFLRLRSTESEGVIIY